MKNENSRNISYNEKLEELQPQFSSSRVRYVIKLKFATLRSTRQKEFVNSIEKRFKETESIESSSSSESSLNVKPLR